MFIQGLIYLHSDYVVFIEWELLTINRNSIVIRILFDWISLLFMRFVLFISSIVIFYRDEYISGDLNINRFIILVLIFVFSIMLLIISPNLIRILLGWDGLGLVSYCLVIYYQNVNSYNAGIITALINRVGDVMLLIAITWILNYGSWNYIFYIDFIREDKFIFIIGLLVMVAGITKRAQIPFSSWLPAAMAAPTPVSALVHSSTLVTAGVYLLIRFNIVLSGSLSIFLLLIASLTIFMAGLGANFEFDLKKIIALSTLSQLGLIIRILSLGNYKLAFFHLLTHALFKALLFICAGAVIHNLKDTQDIRFMGNLITNIPLTCVCLNISNLALCGIPFLAGFYSKDLILEIVRINYINILIFLLFFVSTGLTVCYSFRLCYYSITGDFNFYRLHSLNDEGWIMLKSIIFIVLFVVFMGRTLSWLIFPRPLIICLPLWIKTLALTVRIIGMVMGYQISKFSLGWSSNSLKFYKYRYFFGFIWFLPNISTYTINYTPLVLRFRIYKNFDQGWNEYFGAQGLYNNLKNNSIIIQFIHMNNIKIYLIMMTIWLIILFLFILIYFHSLYLEHNIEDIKEIIKFESIYKNIKFYSYIENVKF